MRTRGGSAVTRIAGCCLLAIGSAAVAPAAVVQFEDLFGPCGEYSLVRGPGTVVTEGVTFTTADIYSYNIGQEASYPPGLGNPFESDAYLFFAFGPGATIDFPQPIRRVRFRTGQYTNMAGWPTFQLIAEGQVYATFGANLWTPEFVDASFPQPVQRVTIQWLGTGSASELGIDELDYTPAWPRGDLNCDGAVTFLDINPFVLALSDRPGYEAQYPDCDWWNADCNLDGAVDFNDINPFVALLTTG